MVLRMVLASVAVSLAATSAVRAQVTPLPSGITVTGRGVVRVRADELRFSAVLFANNIRQPSTTAAAPANVDGAADAVATALRAGGVTDAATGYAGGFNPNGPRTVTGSIHHPTREGVDALLKRGNDAALPFANVTLQNVNLSFLVDDCTDPETRAQNAALSDARRRAERVARAAGLHLGKAVTINEAQGYGPSNCATLPDSQPFAAQAMNGSADAGSLGDVFVSVNATVTYAIAP